MRNDAFSLQLRNSLQPRNDAAQHARRRSSAAVIDRSFSPTARQPQMMMINASGALLRSHEIGVRAVWMRQRDVATAIRGSAARTRELALLLD